MTKEEHKTMMVPKRLESGEHWIPQKRLSEYRQRHSGYWKKKKKTSQIINSSLNKGKTKDNWQANEE